MRRFCITSLITLALVVGAAGVAPAAHAQFETLVDSPLTEQQANQAAADAAAAKAVTENKTTADEAYSGIMQKIMTLFAWLVGVAAITLDNAVYYTVVTMGTYVNQLSAVGVTWSILRDIGNIILIFGFLAVGITTILNVNWYGGGKKMLPMLFVAAVFLNFSLFLSEAVIDTGNLFATQFYTQINGGAAAGAKDLTFDAITNEGISSKIMSQLGLQNIYGAALEPSNAAIFKAGNTWLIGFMGVILFLITAFVMFSLAFILVARFVILLFLIIIAPVGFAGLAVPKLSSLASKWWSKLFEQTLTAPVLLLLLYIALAVITDVRFMTGFGSSTNPDGWVGWIQRGTNMDNLPGFAGMVLSFLVAMGLLLAVVILSKSLSAFGGSWATKTAGKLSFGATAWGLRSTAGWGLNAAARRFRSSKLARVPVIGRVGAGVLDYGAKANFDVRGATAFGGLKAVGIDAGKAQEGGYRKQEEEAIKRREEHAKTLEQTSGKIFGVEFYKGEKEKQKIEEEQKKTAEERLKTAQFQSDREMQDLLNRHKVDSKPFSDRVDAERRVLDAAKATGNQQSIASAQLAFNNALLDSQKKREEQNKEREALKKVHDQMIKVQKDEIEARQKNIDAIKRGPQESYAKNILWGPGKFLYRNEKAATNIVTNAGKSREQKDVETLLDMVKKAVPPATGAAPATTPPPATGGAPTP